MGHPPAYDGPAIAVSDLRMRYGDKDVLTGLDLEIEPGGVTALLGPNGAGKTTTIEILEGFRGRSDGEVSVLGVDPARGDEAWRARLGVVLQEWRDNGKWKVRDIVGHFAEYYRPYTEPWGAGELLEMVGLTAQAGQRIQTLSGGQRRRLDVALGIIGKPSLLFLDEPTTGFDPHARREFHELIHRLTDLDGTTILLTTHDLDEAEKLAERIVILAGGRIIADGSPDQLARAAATTAEVKWIQEGQLQIHATEDATDFVRKLLATDDGKVTELEIHRASLEDAYLELVAKFEAGQAATAVDTFLAKLWLASFAKREATR
ncbi:MULTISPECIES: ABC transporter ATP-binding protein [Glycomyces]|uniref:ABC transporter ATP-binding protein n=2 Tax=Glycomyces TaxID=58113 RepID=A0A9X3PHK2_9ACTN|nr:ABC transporter ATP-binding protein [Glycomyces lechevalierae]MDA1385495.1 ABC transporter ATP-binding protein [Glycomyces lechevalierae]MDR7339668.1 ABC-2 type transport system ATP-binding protein [Glycomyces lechevalierae]